MAENSICSSSKNIEEHCQEGEIIRGGHASIISSSSSTLHSSMTPTKRRLVQNKNTSSLIQIFSTLPGTKPEGYGESESPAKRVRYNTSSGGV